MRSHPRGKLPGFPLERYCLAKRPFARRAGGGLKPVSKSPSPGTMHSSLKYQEILVRQEIELPGEVKTPQR